MKNRKDVENDILDDMRKIKARLKKDKIDITSVPYDKDSARSAIEQFLTLHPDKEDFVKKLKSKMDS